MSRVILVAIASAALAVSAQAMTIGTFADPALDGSTPLFTIDLNADLVTGGWGDSQTGLNLDLLGTVHNDAWFSMSPLVYTSPLFTGQTGPGTILFFADGTNSNPLLQIDFASAQISVGNLAGDNIFSANSVVMTVGPGGPTVYTQEASFAFSFANQIPIKASPTAPPTGFTTTAAFTSSAVPEPAVALMLLLGAALAIRRR